MKIIMSTLITLGAAAALTAGTARAQQQSSQSSGAQSAMSKAESQAFFRASKLVGKDIENPNGQKLGAIQEIVFNKQGEVFALVDIGKGRLATVPWQAINTESPKGDQYMMLNTTSESLKYAPAVSKDQWGALNNPNFTQAAYAYYHLQSPTQAGGASSPGGASQGQGTSEQQQPK